MSQMYSFEEVAEMIAKARKEATDLEQSRCLEAVEMARLFSTKIPNEPDDKGWTAGQALNCARKIISHEIGTVIEPVKGENK